MTEALKEKIRDKAHELGFAAVGFAAAMADPADAEGLSSFLADGRHGDMAWMDNADGRRGDPQAIMAEAKSIIVLGANNGPDKPLPPTSEDRGEISIYAQGRDYHTVLKKKLKQLGRWLADDHDAGIKVFVDTAPVMEKPLAGRSGIGWQGKHTNLVSREFGSWLFLGEVFTTLDLAPDRSPDGPKPDHCGSCDRCLRACPTDALAVPYQIEPRHCISYLTIEHKGNIAPVLMAAMGNHIYGCDDCLAVCPWNKFQGPATINQFRPRDGLSMPRLADLVTLDDASFRELFAGSPIKRTGRERFIRNVLIAIGNGGDENLLTHARALINDPSPVVADAARWAARQLENSGISATGI